MKLSTTFLWLLAPLGWLYGNLMLLRRKLYEWGWLASYTLPGTTISVGNLEAGGTGKSPIVMAVAQLLLHQGSQPAILTRGYRSGLGPDDSAVLFGSQVLLAPQSGQIFHADEATMQAQRLQQVPVIIGSNRWMAAQRYLQNFPAPSHWILDDGFQHLKLRRHKDIVLLNAPRPLAEGRCLPAGRLRERPCTLQKAQLILLTRATHAEVPKGLQEFSQKYSIPIQPVFFTNGEPLQASGPQHSWSQVRSCLLALGIAHPARVIQHCQAQKYPLQKQLLVADHSLFLAEDLHRLAAEVEAILTTEKDYWRQPVTFQSLVKPVFILPLELSFADGDSLSGIVGELTDSL